MQQDKAYRIRKEFKERINNCEEEIKLKYYNGIPSIIRKKKHNTISQQSNTALSIIHQNVRGSS